IRLTSHLYLLMLRAGSAGGGFGERGSAKGATACRNRHITETFRAFFGGRVGSDFSAPHSGQNRVHRQHDKKIYSRSDQDERDQRVDKIADRKLATIDGEFDRREIRFSDNGCDQRRDQIFYQGGDDCAKRNPITTATARSRTLPRKMNCLKPCNIS